MCRSVWSCVCLCCGVRASVTGVKALYLACSVADDMFRFVSFVRKG